MTDVQGARAGGMISAMNRRQLLASAAGIPLAARALISEPAKASPLNDGVWGPSSNSASNAAKSSGRPNYERYQLTFERVLSGENPAYTPEFLMEDLRGTPGRRFTNFSGDLSGRWIGALAASASAFNEQIPALHSFVENALPLQHPEGYFGASFNVAHPSDDDMALLWGNGRLLVGLMEYYAVRRDDRVMKAARGLGDFLVRIGPEFNSKKMADAFNAAHFASSYICWTQQTEGLAALYAATGDARYRDLCADIASRMERRAGDHVHGYLCSVRGMLDLYFATGNRTWLERTVAAWKDVANSGDLLITGGVPEAWSPKKRRTEGCAECDWLRLNLALHRATGDAVYLDAAEDVLFNDFSMNQFCTGDFGHAVLDEYGAPGAVQVRAWWCCTLHGLRAFSDVQRSAFRVRGREIAFDLPVDGSVKTDAIWLESQSFLATEGRIVVKVHRASGAPALTVRKPVWAESVTLSRNGRPLDGLRADGLGDGDEVEAIYGMKLRVGSADSVLTSGGRSALHYGPWLLGATTAVQPEYFNELHPENVLLMETARPSASRSKVQGESRFTAPGAAIMVGFVPAEYPEQKGQVELRAVAEQTANEPARWATSFVTRSS